MLINEKAKRKEILDRIWDSRNMISRQQAKTLIGQAKAKDYNGANKGLNKLLGRNIDVKS